MYDEQNPYASPKTELETQGKRARRRRKLRNFAIGMSGFIVLIVLNLAYQGIKLMLYFFFNLSLPG